MNADLLQTLVLVEPPHYAFLGALIGGLLGRSDAKKAARAAAEAAKVPIVTSHTVDLKGMNAAAIEAGYNPMTILNAGGLSGWTTTSTIGHNAMAAAQAKGAVPSIGSVISGALSSTIDSLAGAAFKSMAPMSSSYFPPAPTPDLGMAGALGWGKMQNTAGGGNAGGGGLQFRTTPTLSSSKVGAYMAPTQEAGEVVNPHSVLSIDPTAQAAEAWETYYSEPGGYVGMMDNIKNTLIYSATGITKAYRETMYGGAIAQLKKGALSTDAITARIKEVDMLGKVWSALKPPPTQKDNFNDPFPAWGW